MYYDNAVPLTKPIDTAQNTLLHRRQQQRMYSTLPPQSAGDKPTDIGSLPSGTTEAQTFFDRKDLASLNSSGNQDAFEAISPKECFSKTHFLKRADHKLLKMAAK